MKLSTKSFVAFTVYQQLSSSVYCQNEDNALVKRNKPQGLPSKRVLQGKGTKMMKKAKSGKAGVGPKAFVAVIEALDGSALLGTGTLRFNQDDSFLFALNMNGISNDGTGVIGTAVITDGTSCENISETPFTDGDEFDGTVNKYEAVSAGISKSAFTFDNGHSRAENMGKTVLLFNDLDVAIGCGILQREVSEKVLLADMGVYPSYTGDFTPRGTVKVNFHDDDTFTFSYSLKGLDADCSGCGIHIHAGKSCASHDLVLGHEFNSVVVQDLWTAAGGASYESNGMGRAVGSFVLYNGFGYEVNKHHAVVIHMQDGTRVACGTLL